MNRSPSQNNVLLELHVPDFKDVKDFYNKLGFNVVWERKPEKDKGYLVMKYGNNILCFFCGNEKVHDLQPYFNKFPRDTIRGYGVEIIIMVDNVDKTYAKAKTFANITEKLQMRPWGLKDFRVADPFGYYLRITEPHDILDEGNAVP